MKFLPTFLILLPLTLCAQEAPETWSSVDGRKLEATGISWSSQAITLKRSSDGQVLILNHAQLAPADVIRAVNSLPFEINDNVRLRARTLEVSSKQLERETGNYAATVDSFRYNGSTATANVTVTPINEKYKISGRRVRVDLSSMSGPGYVAVEFFAIAGQGNTQSIFNTQKRIVEFAQHGSQLIFSCAAVENFKGWVVLARSLNTGKIIAMEGSMQGLETLVTARVPEISTFTTNLEPLKASVIAAAEARRASARPPEE